MSAQETPPSINIVGGVIEMRHLTTEDAPAMHDLARQERHFAGKFINWVEAATLPRVQSRIENDLRTQERGGGFAYGLFDGSTMLGRVSVLSSQDGVGGIVECMIARRANGQGIATEATTTASRIAMAAFGITELHMYIDERNRRSVMLAQRLGARPASQFMRGQEHYVLSAA